MAETIQLTPEQKRDRFQKLAKVGLMIGAGLLFAPFAAAAIGGLIGLLLAALIAVVGINTAPIVARRLAIWKMNQLMEDARKHPIETMRIIYAYNVNRIRLKDEKIREMAARLLDFKSQAAEFAKKWPAKATQYDQMINAMQAVLDRWKAKQKVAKKAAEEYKDKINEAEDTFAMAKAASGLQELSAETEAEINNEIQQKVAFDEVSHSFNLAVADLTTDVDTDPDFGLDKKKEQELAFFSGSSTHSASQGTVKEKEEVRQ